MLRISKKYLMPVLLLSMVVIPRIAFPQNNPSDSTDIQRQVVGRLAERFGFRANWANCGYSISVDRNGRIIGLNGIHLQPDSTNRLSELAYRFLETNGDVFGIENPRQELPLSKEALGTVTMYQVVNGIKVLNAFVQIGFNGDAGSAYIDFSCFPEARNINTTPSIDSLQAFSIALSDPVNDTLPAWPHNAKLIIAKFDDGFHLVWDFFVSDGGYYEGHAEYFIDAHDGNVEKIASAIRR